MTMVSLGRKVHYQLSEADVAWINANLPDGVNGVHRNAVHTGDVYAADVVRVFEASPENLANLAVQLDGNCTFWATSRHEGTEPGTWKWPLRS